MDDETFNDPKIANAWIRTVESDSSGIREQAGDVYPRLRAWIQKNNPRNILELGSGQGICSSKIDLENRTYTGLEGSILLVDRARELYIDSKRTFLQGDVYQLPFREAEFDAVFSIAVWHLLSDLDRASRELERVLRPGGSFLIITANPAAYFVWTERYQNPQIKGKRFQGVTRNLDGTEETDILYLHTLEEIQTSLKKFGLLSKSLESFRINEKSRGEGLLLSISGSKSITGSTES